MTVANSHHEWCSSILVFRKYASFVLNKPLTQLVAAVLSCPTQRWLSVRPLTCIYLGCTRVQESLNGLLISILAGVGHSCLVVLVPQLPNIFLVIQYYTNVFCTTVDSSEVQRRLLLVVDIIDIGAFGEKDPERAGPGATCSVVNWLLVPCVHHIDVWVLGEKFLDDTLLRIDSSEV